MTLIEEARLLKALPDHTVCRQIREDARVEVTRIASEVGVSRQTISLWESGRRRPRGQAGLKYARILADLKSVIEAA